MSDYIANLAVASDVRAALNALVDISGIAGEAIPAIGRIVYFDPVSGKWSLTDTTTESKSGPVAVGVALNVAAQDGALSVRRAGPFITTGLTPGLQWMSGAGVSTTAPTTDGHVRRIFGYALSATLLYVDPSKEWVVAGIDAALINENTELDYTFGIGDHQAIVERNNANPNNTIIPLNTLPIGFECDMMQVGSGLSSLVGAIGVIVNGVLEEGGDETKINSQGQWKGFSLYQRKLNEWVAIGKAEA